MANYNMRVCAIKHIPSPFRQKYLQLKTKIKSFYLTEKSILTARIIKTLSKVVLTASIILKKNYLKKFNKGEKNEN